jgi:hypothetical protein
MRPTPARNRALFLKERAFEMVSRQGTVQRIGNAGIGREFKGAGFSVWYADPETAECDEFHHLDVHTEAGKVLSVRWLVGGSPEVITFRRGAWESYFLA